VSAGSSCVDAEISLLLLLLDAGDHHAGWCEMATDAECFRSRKITLVAIYFSLLKFACALDMMLTVFVQMQDLRSQLQQMFPEQQVVTRYIIYCTVEIVVCLLCQKQLFHVHFFRKFRGRIFPPNFMYIFNPSLFAVLQISRTCSVKKFLDYCGGLSTGSTELVQRWGS
jgi:hypothetical protein